MKRGKKLYILLATFLLASCDWSFVSNPNEKPYVEYTISLEQINSKTGWVHISDADGNIIDGATSDPFNSSIYIKYQVNKGQGHDYDFENDFSNEMGYYSALFDRHNYYSYKGKLLNNIRVLNDSYGTGEAIVVPDILYNSLKKALNFSLITDNKFSIGIGNLSSLWDAYISAASSAGSLYDKESTMQQRVIYNDIAESYVEFARMTSPLPAQLAQMLVFNDDDHSITFNSDQAVDDYVDSHLGIANEIKISSTALDLTKPSITLGGFGKGEATELFVENHNEKSYLMNSGHSSIKCINQKIDGTSWSLTVASPYYYESVKSGNINNNINNSDIYFTHDGSFDLSTSGYYENYFYAYEDGKYVLRHHILDPLTGYSNNTFASASVLLDDSGYADMYTTALMNASSISEAEQLRKQMDQYTNLNSEAYYLINSNVDNKKKTTCYVTSSLRPSFKFTNETWPNNFENEPITSIETIRE